MYRSGINSRISNTETFAFLETEENIPDKSNKTFLGRIYYCWRGKEKHIRMKWERERGRQTDTETETVTKRAGGHNLSVVSSLSVLLSCFIFILELFFLCHLSLSLFLPLHFSCLHLLSFSLSTCFLWQPSLLFLHFLSFYVFLHALLFVLVSSATPFIPLLSFYVFPHASLFAFLSH